MNVVMLMGRLTAEPEITRGNSIFARYTLAVDRRVSKEGEQTADFIRCVTFGKSAEFVEKYLSKGMKIAIDGRIQTGSYTNKDGVKVYTTDVVVNNHYFCESGKGASVQNNDEGFENIPDGIDEDLPFANPTR